MDEEVTERLKKIEAKVDSLREILRLCLKLEEVNGLLPLKSLNSPETRTEVYNKENAHVRVYLLRLPDSLRRTMLVMERLGEATTVEVARETGRSRSVESIHLNQLERMGYLEKYRKGRKIYFKVPQLVVNETETANRRRPHGLY